MTLQSSTRTLTPGVAEVMRRAANEAILPHYQRLTASQIEAKAADEKIARGEDGALLGVPLAEVSSWGHLIFKGRSSPEVTPWHQDEAYWDMTKNYNALGSWLAVDKVDTDNGCLWFVPGSHRWGAMSGAKVRSAQLRCHARPLSAIARTVGIRSSWASSAIRRSAASTTARRSPDIASRSRSTSRP